MTYFNADDQHEAARLCEHFNFSNEANVAGRINQLRMAAHAEPVDAEAQAAVAMLDYVGRSLAQEDAERFYTELEPEGAF